MSDFFDLGEDDLSSFVEVSKQDGKEDNDDNNNDNDAEKAARTETATTKGTAQKETLRLRVIPSHNKVNLGCGDHNETKRIKVSVNLRACDIPIFTDSNTGADGASSRAPVDIAVGLDRSGSMTGEKLRGCLDTLTRVVRHLGSNDRLCLVSFSHDARLDFPMTFMTNENKVMALSKIASIRAGGGTNLSGGLATAALELAKIQNPNPVRSIFLLTDGHPNGGISNTVDLVAMVSCLNQGDNVMEEDNDNDDDDLDDYPALQRAAASAGVYCSPKLNPVVVNKPISLFCFGYGSDHNSHMLKEISDATPSGAYYFVERDSDVATAFGDAMGGLLSVVAQGISVSISVPPHAAAKGVQISKVYHKEAICRDDGTHTVNVGDFYAEEERDVLLEVTVPKSEIDKGKDDNLVQLVDVQVSFMDIMEKRVVCLGPVSCGVIATHDSSIEVTSSDGIPNEHVEVQWLRIQTIQAMKDANTKAAAGGGSYNISLSNFMDKDDGGDLGEARKLLDIAESNILGSFVFKKYSQTKNQQHNHPANAGAVTSSSSYILLNGMLEDIRELKKGFLSMHAYAAMGSHSSASVCQGYERQRCAASSISKSNPYRTSHKQTMSSEFM